MAILLLADHDNSALHAATRNAVAAAAQIGGELTILVAGHDAGPAAQAAARIPGVARVLHAEAPYLANPTAENLAATVVAVAKAGGYSHVLAPATGFGKNVAPRVAALLDVAQVSDIIAVESPDTFVRPIYAGSAFATVQSKDPIKVITVRATGFDAVAATGGSAAVEAVDATPDSGLSSMLGREIAKSDRPELTAARIVVSGGRAMG